MIIGVTGSFGSGKTTVSRMFGSLGLKVIDADIVSHELMLPGKAVYKKIIRHFGKDIIKADKAIDRVRLADIVFDNASKLKLLNKLVHPETIKKIERLAHRKKTSFSVVVEGALLIESGFYKKLDSLIVVRSKRSDQIDRIMKAKGMTKKDVLKRLRSQEPLKRKLAFADFVIDNSGSKNETRTQVKKIWKQLGGTEVDHGCKSKT